jgi:hypothetical protein
MGSKATRRENENSNLVMRNIHAIVGKLLKFLNEKRRTGSNSRRMRCEKRFTGLFTSIATTEIIPL